MSTVNIDFKADASPVAAAAAKANAALNSIGVSADNASKKIAPAMGNLSGGAQKAAAALGPLGGVLSKISPEAGAAASSLAGAASAAVGMGQAMMAASGSATVLQAAMGPIGLALAAVTVIVGAAIVAYNMMGESAERAAAGQQALKAASVGVLAVEGQAEKSAYDLKKAKGELTELDVKYEARRASFAANEAARTQLSLMDTSELSEADKARFEQKRIDLINGAEAAAKAASKLAVYQFNEEARTKAQTKADKESADAKARRDAAQADADKRKDEAARALKTAVDAVAGAEKELAKITHDASMTHASKMEKEVDSYEAKVARTVELGEIELANAELLGTDRTEIVKRTTDAQFALAGEHALNVRNLQKEELAAKKKLEEDKLAAEEDAEEKSKKENEDAAKVKKDQAMDLANFMADQAVAGLDAMAEGFAKAKDNANHMAEQLTGQLIAGDATYTKAQKAELVKRIAEQRANAKEAFAIEKAAKLSAAVVTTAMAVINAYNSGVALPIGGAVLGPAMAVAAGVTGAISIATIAAEQPSFHSGKSPDEMQATILKKEAVLNTTAAANMGRGRVEQMNNGHMQGNGNGGPAPIVLGHRVFEAGLKRSLDSAGVLREALRAGSVYGHRTNRRISSV